MKNKLIRVKKLKPSLKKQQQTTLPAVISNENIADHREEVLGKGRKFIYPLRHSKHRLVKISAILLVTIIVGFFCYCVLALYKIKSDSGFMYQVTKVIPFPLARIGSDFVSYESYLFELKHYTHYYETQQNIDFSSESGKPQLIEYKKRALQKVINDAYVKQIAEQKGITVTDKEVNDEISIIRSQNRLGSSDKEFETVLSDFWDWSVDDFKNSLRMSLLTQKVVASLDTEAKSKADKALAEIKGGKDFAQVAKEVSEDANTKDKGGDFGVLIDKNNRDISPKTVEAVFKLKQGEVSNVINIGYGLEILKNLEQKDDQIRPAHIIFYFKDINNYLSPIKDQKPSRLYVSF